MNEAIRGSSVDAPPAIPADVGADDHGLTAVRIGDGTQPAWRRDALSVSARVRAILATLQPVVIRALAFWDHAVRSVRIGAARIEIDPSGSYRLRP